ncbi:MAG: nucleoside deaminase [Flavobacteriaceae bacterium]|nr:nucleoside deaminase [Flavobacteriaceae bacterium]
MLLPPIYDDTYFMKKALEQAQIAYEKDEVPVGAVVVVGNRIIGRGHNSTELLSDVTAHAEIIAMTAAAQHLGGKYLKDCTLYVSLEPCAMCAGAMYWFQLSKLVFAASDLQRGFMKNNAQLHPKTTIQNGLLAEEASELLKQFFKQKRG